MPLRDPHQTISALLRMTEARGCTPHEAATAKGRAQAIAARLGLSLETFVPKPEAPHRAAGWTARESQAQTWEAAERKRAWEARRQRERDYEDAKRWFSLQPQQRRLAEIFQTLWEHGRAGAPIEVLAFALGNLEPHTVRAMIHRLRKIGFSIRTERVDGRAVYYWEEVKN